MALCRPGGLTGRYSVDSSFQDEEFQRVDRRVRPFVVVCGSQIRGEHVKGVKQALKLFLCCGFGGEVYLSSGAK